MLGPHILRFLHGRSLTLAITARNPIFYSSLEHDEPTATIWNIFFLFSMDNRTTAVLAQQCQQLIDASSSMESWAQSPFGRTYKMCSSWTLAELHRHWALYASFTPAVQQVKRLERERMKAKGAEKGRRFIPGMYRSAGVF